MPSAQRVAQFGADTLRFLRIHQKFRDFSMIPRSAYVGNLHLAAKVRDVPGSAVECGTWRGGMIAGIADVLGPDRPYFLFDSFEGLPPSTDQDGPDERQWTGKCVAEPAEAEHAMALSAARQVSIVKGWFQDTLARTDTGPIALLRLDGDWYDSTVCALEAFAHRVVPGGLIVVDDYYTWDGCTKAINEYAARTGLRIHQSRAGICFLLHH